MITAIFVIFLMITLGLLANMLPDKVRAVVCAGKAIAKKPRVRCDYCGYDLRASPDYCPECGAGYDTFRKAASGVRAARPSRSIVFRALPAGEDLLLTVPCTLVESLGRLFRQRPGDIDLLFGASGGEGEELTSSQDLLDAAMRTMALVGGDGSQRELLILLRRLQHFARQHAYARVTRNVSAAAGRSHVERE